MSVTKMSPEALQNDRELGLPLLPVTKIYLDHEFNCRGQFSAHECIELAQDIGHRGLQQPITVRGIRRERKGPIEADPPNIQAEYDYVALAGHRRLTAYRINTAETIPAIVKDAYIDDFQAHDLNAIENLQRKELNLLQEANSIRHYWMAGWSETDCGQRISKSRGWVQTRYQLLCMPEDVQEAAAQGYIRVGDVRDLYTYRDNLEMLRKKANVIKEFRQSGKKDTSVLKRVVKKPDKATDRRHRKREQMLELQAKIQEAFDGYDISDTAIMADDLVSKYGNNLATRVLAWAAGEISSREVHQSIKDYLELFEIPYDMPFFTPESF